MANNKRLLKPSPYISALKGGDDGATSHNAIPAWLDGKDGRRCLGWATRYIEELQRGTTVQFRPRGNSMTGKIDSGQLVTVQPTGEHELNGPIHFGD